MFSKRKNHIGNILKALTKSARAIGDHASMERCESLLQEYRYMLGFIASGGKDDDREKFLFSLKKRVDELGDDIKRQEVFLAIPGHEIIFNQMKGMDTSASALIESLKNVTLSPSEHYEVLSKAFSAVLFSNSWSQRDQRMWTAYMIASDTNLIDAQTILSAIMLSCRIKFCKEKFRTMAYVYLTTDVEALRQRALVGWCVCLSNLKDAQLADDLLESEKTRKEVLKLIMQMMASTDADKDGEKIKREIMPELLKHQMKSGILSDDIIKSNEDTLADILNPGREEQEMEEVEKSIGKMTDMMKNGADVFFGEFSKMKRYPFFYKPVNWFMPFTYEHPLLADARKRLDGIESLDHIYRNGPFCDSDKYSFTFGFASVISSLPVKIKEMLSVGEVGPLGTLPKGSEREITPDYLRRMYLQDLYRFYNLSPQLKLSTVFTEDVFFAPFDFKQMKEMILDYGKFLVRRGHYDLLYKLLTYKVDNMTRAANAEYSLLYAMMYSAQGEHRFAYKYYQFAYVADNNSKSAIRGCAKYAMQFGNYEDASKFYAKLCEMNPESLAYAQNKILANVCAGKASEMLNEIYRLDIENDNNLSIKRLLGWTLMCNGRIEQAESICCDIVKGDYGEPSVNDYLTLVELYWVSDRPNKAIGHLKRLLDDISLAPDADRCAELLHTDLARLKLYFPVVEADAMLIMEAVTLL